MSRIAFDKMREMSMSVSGANGRYKLWNYIQGVKRVYTILIFYNVYFHFLFRKIERKKLGKCRISQNQSNVFVTEFINGSGKGLLVICTERILFIRTYK